MLFQFAKLVSTACLLVFITGCASTPPTSEYTKFAVVGNKYAESLSRLIQIAQDTALDKNSAELIDQNLFADRSSPTFVSQETARLASLNKIDTKRIKVFSTLRAHIRALNKYFNLLNELATSGEAEETNKALVKTSGSLATLTKTLTDQDAFILDDDAQQRLGVLVNYIFDTRIKAALRARIRADEELLQKAIKTHEELFVVIKSDLESNIAILRNRRVQRVLEGPFTSQSPLMNDPLLAGAWINARRNILSMEAALSELNTASNAAGTLNKALKKLINGDDDFLVVLDQFITELESIDSAIDSIKG